MLKFLKAAKYHLRKNWKFSFLNLEGFIFSKLESPQISFLLKHGFDVFNFIKNLCICLKKAATWLAWFLLKSDKLLCFNSCWFLLEWLCSCCFAQYKKSFEKFGVISSIFTLLASHFNVTEKLSMKESTV